MPVQVTNNAWGELSVPITAEATQILLSGAQGDRFPNAVEDVSWFYATLVDSENNIEIIKCVARSGDTLTVVRAVDGTEARAYKEGSRLELRPVAALFNDKASKDEVEKQLDALETDLKEADQADYKALEKLINEVKDTYVTKEELEKTLKDRDESNEDNYLTIKDAEKAYLPLKGGTLTGSLTVSPESGSVGIVVKSKTGAGISVQGGDLTLSSYKDTESGRTYGGNLTADATIKGQLLRSTSDVREKNSIVPLDDGEAVGITELLTPVYFKWNNTMKDDIGLIAQEVERVLPEAVGKDHDGRLSLSYATLVAVALAAIKDLKREIEELKCQYK